MVLFKLHDCKGLQIYLVFIYLLCVVKIQSLSRNFTISKADCKSNEFACHDGSLCIPTSWFCDFIPDCVDGSDEPKKCPNSSCHGSFKCKVNHRCVPISWVCDGEPDCGPGDSSDEQQGSCHSSHICPPNRFLCNDGATCIPIQSLCDKKPDCPDGGDEGDFCSNTSQCQSSRCSHGCRPSPQGENEGSQGALCYCPEGKEPLHDKCIDVNQCKLEPCDQMCHNDGGRRFSCSCAAGYVLMNSRRCSAVNDPITDALRIVYAAENRIEQLYPNGSLVTGDTFLNATHVTALEVDHGNRTLCWVGKQTVKSKSNLFCADVDSISKFWQLPKHRFYGLEDVHSIDLDWVTGNWYILDSRELIFVCNRNFSVCITLVEDLRNKPGSAALDPSSGIMFVSGWGVSKPRIERFSMDGTNRITIVDKKLVFPTGLSIDYPNRHVYWIDGYLNRIERVDYNGKNRKSIYRMSEGENVGMALFENKLFLTTGRNNEIKRLNKRWSMDFNQSVISGSEPLVHEPSLPESPSNSGTDDSNAPQVVRVTDFEPHFIQVFHRQGQPKVTHPCGSNNGGCSHFCFPLWNGTLPITKCQCQVGYVLQEGGACVGQEVDSFLLHSGLNVIRGVPLDKPFASEVILPITSTGSPIAMDFHAEDDYVYFANFKRFVIERQKVDGSSREVFTDGIYNVDGLAVDWMGRNLYWTDAGVSFIFVCPLNDPTKRRVLAHGELTNVRSIVVDPHTGLVFWSVFETVSSTHGKGGLIESAWMDGSNRRKLVETDLYWPNSLTVDYEEKMLYWCDGYYKKIERIGEHGAKREVILKGNPLIMPYGISYFDGFIYWSDLQNETLNRMNLADRTGVQVLQKGAPRFDIKIFSPLRQKDSNGCERMDCEDFCLSSPEGPRCACRMGMEPSPTHPTKCIPIEKYSPPKQCDEGEFLCKRSLNCIKKQFVCDGENDCHDNSDEESSKDGVCEQVECPFSMFKCNNNKCISSLWVCDGDSDCSEGEDELEDNCKCGYGKFECESGRCISQSWVCDTQEDCGPGDKSDEHENCEYEKCEDHYFTCPDKSCIPFFFVCDAERDCSDGADELFCESQCQNATSFGFTASHYCNLECSSIKNASVCNSFQSCHLCPSTGTGNATNVEVGDHKDGDGEDVCITSVKICDMHPDCPDGSDEIGCPENPKFECKEFACASKDPFPQCIPKRLRCDGNYDCFDQSDEEGCDAIECSGGMFFCSEDRKCLLGSFRCDGQNDCLDGSDEENCTSSLPCPLPNIHCDNGTKCVPPENICDGNQDCVDKADEGSRCGENDCKQIICEGTCHQGSEGPYCVCPEGQTLLEDGLSCSKIHHCEQFGVCSQICIPVRGSYKCDCFDGYRLGPDKHSCKSEDPTEPFLLFSNRHRIRYMNVKSKSPSVKTLVSSLKNTIAIDFLIEPFGDFVFWTDVSDDKIYQGKIVAGEIVDIETIVHSGLATAEGLAVDWVGRNLYWVESASDQIEVCKLTGEYRKTLMSDAMGNPRAIALDPKEAMLFWSDWQEGKARIESSSMSGKGRKVVVWMNSDESEGWPNGITLDYDLKRLYWIDAKSDSIHCVLYNGADRHEVLRSRERLSHPFAISLFGTHVYWTDWRTNSVARANKFTGDEIDILHTTITQPFDLKILHSSRQPKVKKNPCGVKNGGCSHLCLLNFNGERDCACPQIMSLREDNVTCVRKDKILFYSKPEEIRGFDLLNPNTEVITRLPIVWSVPLPIDVFESESMIYWANVKHNKIFRMNISYSVPYEKNTVTEVITSPKAFAIDWLSRNMFIASSGTTQKHILIGNIKGEFLRPVITENISDIESIAVDPYGGKLFWSDVGGILHTVNAATMLGTDRLVLSSQKDNKELKYPTSLSYDPTSKRLYWANRGSNSIQYYDFPKKGFHTLLGGGMGKQPITLTVHESFVYFFDEAGESIYRIDKYTGSGFKVIQKNVSEILSIKIYDKNRANSSNACTQGHSKCAHLCIPINSTDRQCKCAIGFKAHDDTSNDCIGEDNILIYATNLGLTGISVANMKIKGNEETIPRNDSTPEYLLPPLSLAGNVSKLNYHIKMGLLIWYDETDGTITRIHRDGTDKKSLIKDPEAVGGIALDWVSNNVYWSNPVKNVIEVAHLNISERYIIISEDLDRPGALVVHPPKGYLFWVNNGRNKSIERSALDGTNRTVITNSSLSNPIDLCIDYEKDLLYFIDSELRTVEKMKFDGSSRTLFVKHGKKPSSLFVFKSFVYLSVSDNGDNSLEVFRDNDTNRVWKRSIPDMAKSMILISRDAQRESNPCAKNNGGCQDLCFFNGTDVKCHCIHGRIGKDGVTCEDYDAFLLYSNNTSIQSLHLYNVTNPNRPMKTIVSEYMKNVISLAVDYSSKKLFYSDIQRRSISSVYFNGSGHVIVVENEEMVEGIACCDQQGHIFWTSLSDASISRMHPSLDSPSTSITPNRFKIIKLGPEDRPRGIALDACDLRVYWTNWNAKAPSIQRAYINGLNVTSIITTQIRMPNGLVIDHESQKLYWGDARLDKIERCNLDGSNRVVIVGQFQSHPFALTLYGDSLFWTDWRLQAVIRVNKFTGGDLVKLTPRAENLMGIVVVAEDSNACEMNPCRQMNGGCEDICKVDERGQVVCSCSGGRLLLLDGRRCSAYLYNCSKEEFACGSGFCIPYSFACDGVVECPDKSDENPNYCATRECMEGYFDCGNGFCILSNKVCDGHLDCPGFQDEKDCRCSADQFRCADSGFCISANLRCNVEPDCPDASDEMGCGKTDCSSMLNSQFKNVELVNCANTTNCIHPKWICDGFNDCWDNSDEQNCTATSKEDKCQGNDCVDGNGLSVDTKNNTIDNENITCPKGQFRCNSDRKCVQDHWRCDGMKDCEDGSDEPDNCRSLSCSPQYFKCKSSGRCIPMTWVCDGDLDCGVEGEDESPVGGCPFKGHPLDAVSDGFCEEGKFKCRMFKDAEYECIPVDFFCDGIKDCMDGMDEPESCRRRECTEAQFSCDNKRCVPKIWMCNGKDDCGDESDEKNCSTPGKPSNNSVTEDCGALLFRCKNGDCIPLEKLCNGHDDCGDFSDEIHCHINECLQVDPKVCAHKCIDKPIGYSCECYEGFEIHANDSKICQDIDECNTSYPCSHMCTNTYGSYKCSCHEGYVSDDNGETCKANSTTEPHLIISIRHFIREIGLDDSFSRIIVNNMTNVVALDFHWLTQCFYWSDVTHLSSSIKRICKDGKVEILHTTVQSPDGIAVDWVGENLYWCDKGKDTIEVSKLDGKFRKVLIQEGLADPRAIVLDPFHGYLYWTDWGNQPHIGKAGMDGSNPMVLINSTVGWPNALTISYDTQEIFWADAHYDYIGRSDLDGNNRREVLHKKNAPDHLHHIFAITVFEDWIYWTDWELKSVLKAKKYSGTNITKVYSALYRPMDLHVFHPYRQRPLEKNPCEDNGGCSTICLLGPEGNKTCACPQYYVLQDDQVSCNHNCSRSHFVCNTTYKCIPSFWKCDTQNDCGDNSDEPDECPPFNCTPGQFQCKNGNCIHPSQICDNKDQCKDGSDEEKCDEYTCLMSQFKCPAFNGTSDFCIPKKRQCDASLDCPGGEDEKDCLPQKCPVDWFRCNNGQCIPLVWVCDYDNDCSDKSDELQDCPSRKCRDTEFRCTNGRCIPNSWKCDGEKDCVEEEDEAECEETQTCNPLYFKCENSRCIPRRWHCDGDDDCKDGSDEKDCDFKPCSDKEFACANKGCIPKGKKCDGTADCTDGSDELDCLHKNCTADQFQCVTNKACILKEWVCDGDADCGDMSDEHQDCEDNCRSGRWMCKSKECILQWWLCDGNSDCKDGDDEDEEFCAKHDCIDGFYKCNNSRCVIEDKMCDGFDDCGDKSDETHDKCQKLCQPDEFRCKNTRCISKDLVCDGFDDCTDNSDEDSECPTGCRFGMCSQICNVKKNETHSCSCAKGYKLHNWSHKKNQKSCYAEGNLAYMILANDNHLRKLSPYKRSNSAGIHTLTEEDAKNIRIESLTVLYSDPPEVFWTDKHQRKIFAMSIPTTEETSSVRSGRSVRSDGTSNIRVLLEGLDDPRGIAVDWVTKKIYFIDNGPSTISSLTIDGLKRTSLLIDVTMELRDIVLDPSSGRMFYAGSTGFFFRRRSGIKWARMDGWQENSLSSLFLRLMSDSTSLAIDYPAERLYFVRILDKPSLETVTLEAKDHKKILELERDNTDISIDVFEDFIYFTSSNAVFKVGKFGERHANVTKLAQYSLRLTDLAIVQGVKHDNSISNPCAGDPCQRETVCHISGPTNYTCLCPVGMHEIKIAEKIVGCVEDVVEQKCDLPCRYGTCVPSQNGPRCHCNPLYKGPLCNIYRCSDFCQNGGFCKSHPNHEDSSGAPLLVCVCPPEWTGSRCETRLGSCGGDFCTNGGQCSRVTTTSGETNSTCVCKEPYTGKYCRDCRTLSCENGGTCHIYFDGGKSKFTCMCPAGFSGEKCEKASCEHICKNGECIHLAYGQKKCLCHPGWTGDLCDQCMHGSCDDPCDELNCKNGATCKQMYQSKVTAKCECRPGFFGRECQYPSCNGYCVHGRCEMVRGQPSCHCNGGWTGNRCGDDECTGGKCEACSSADQLVCQNRSNCLKNKLSGRSFCRCPLGFIGSTCDVSECDNFCSNGGTCSLEGGVPTCYCPPGFNGLNCFDNDCKSLCVHGICRNTKEGAVCECENGYSGTKCDQILPSSGGVCTTTTCQNGGACLLLKGKATCKCQPSYGGKWCQTKIDVTANSCLFFNCLHGGVCQYEDRAYCACPDGWFGAHCDKSSSCDTFPCENGGTCTITAESGPVLTPRCKCVDGYSGDHCDEASLGTPDGSTDRYNPSNTATIVVAVLVAVLSVIGLVAGLVVWRRRGKGIGHVRLHENNGATLRSGGTVELSNPMYLHTSEEHDVDGEPVFTLHESANNFKNPVYDIMYETTSSETQDEKANLLQADPLGVLEESNSHPLSSGNQLVSKKL